MSRNQKFTLGCLFTIALTVCLAAVIVGLQVMDATTADMTNCLGYCQRTGYRLGGFEECMNRCQNPTPPGSR